MSLIAIYIYNYSPARAAGGRPDDEYGDNGKAKMESGDGGVGIPLAAEGRREMTDEDQQRLERKRRRRQKQRQKSRNSELPVQTGIHRRLYQTSTRSLLCTIVRGAQITIT
eukprot:COSAG02_NODE_1152_length_14201_cov_9.055595_8_plen_111_part_00